jgi:hypothetical protein
MFADEELYAKFKLEAVRCSAGYLLFGGENRGWNYGYLVTENAEIYGFARRGDHELRRVVFAAIKSYIPIERMKRTKLGPEEMKAIAKRVGGLNPSIGMVLLP